MSEVSEIYKQVRVHIGLQMCKRKFTSLKYMCHYSYAKFGTFFAPPVIKKNFCLYFTHLPRSLLGGICIKFCTTGPLADVINRAKIYLNQVRGFDSVGGQEREVAINTGLELPYSL